MNNINDLIKDFCDTDVEYKSLYEIGELLSGLKSKTKNDFINGNKKYIPYLNVFNNCSINKNNFQYVKIEPNEKQNEIKYGDIIFTNSSENLEETGMSSVVNWYPNEDIYLNSFCFIFRLNNLKFFNVDFLKHLFRSKNLRNQIVKCCNGVTRFNLSKKSFLNIQIPIPPIEVQNKIVEILDKQTELTAELTARTKQYNYYRDLLLSSEEWMSANITIKKLKDIAEIKRGRVISKIDIRDNYGEYPVYSSQTLNNGEIGKINTYDFDGEYLTWTTDGAYAGTVFYRNGKFSITNICGLIKIKDRNINSKFAYYITSIIFPKLVNRSSNNPKMMSNVVENIEIPIPPIEVQNKIVEILDKFSNIVQDLNIGIPKEIELRTKQYEYYRNKLLDFKQKD